MQIVKIMVYIKLEIKNPFQKGGILGISKI